MNRIWKQRLRMGLWFALVLTFLGSMSGLVLLWFQLMNPYG